MKQLKKTLLTLALLLTAATGARAAWTGGTYTATATENLGAITVNGDATLTINSDVTVTVTGGINVASGTLTVTGPGTLVVTGAKGNDGASAVEEGGNGGNGGVAISGNIIVQGGATVTATGGTGGNGGSGEIIRGGNGGNGGNAFAGTLTYKSGTVTANGGSGGSGGWGDEGDANGFNGSAGKAFANDVDFTQTTGYSVTNGTSTIESVLKQRMVVISGGSEPAAPSGPEVAWDKATKTGTFTMPGGNVTLEPEYYPQAALTAAPTAVNDVPATTDGAIVSAGTVANIGETTTAQGTVMYYVSTTEMTDAQLLALAADQWTADVPTAESLAQGQAYVYYYVRGNDSENDEENFSDGDILAANALTVTIAAEPTYAVTFADDTAEPTLWKAEPATDVKKGTDVTVTYTGAKKVIGVKAEKKVAATARPLAEATAEDLGKIAGADGNIYDTKAAAEAANTTAVAMIVYVGSETGDATYNHGLALALTDEGGMAWEAAKTACSTKNTNTPVTGATWLLASKDQWTKMIDACKNVLGTKNNYQDLRDGFDGITGASNLQSGYYWSSTEHDPVSVWFYLFDNGGWVNGSRSNGFRVRACLAF